MPSFKDPADDTPISRAILDERVEDYLDLNLLTPKKTRFPHDSYSARIDTGSMSRNPYPVSSGTSFIGTVSTFNEGPVINRDESENHSSQYGYQLRYLWNKLCQKANS